jgi:hypothetical protein
MVLCKTYEAIIGGVDMCCFPISIFCQSGRMVSRTLDYVICLG